MKKFNAIREESLLEKLKSSDPAGKWIHDFVHSDNPRFAGKSKKERIRMALGASYGAKRNEEIEYHFNVLEEAVTSIDKGEYDYEGQMTRTQLQTILRNSKDLIEMISNSDNMPEWVQSKITLAQDYISSVRDYLQSKGELGEEVEQIDELSKSTLGSYIKKAANSKAEKAYGTGYWDRADSGNKPEYVSKGRKVTGDSDDHYNSQANRNKGIKRAVTKLTKEDAELGEESGTTKQVIPAGVIDGPGGYEGAQKRIKDYEASKVKRQELPGKELPPIEDRSKPTEKSKTNEGKFDDAFAELDKEVEKKKNPAPSPVVTRREKPDFFDKKMMEPTDKDPKNSTYIFNGQKVDRETYDKLRNQHLDKPKDPGESEFEDEIERSKGRLRNKMSTVKEEIKRQYEQILEYYSVHPHDENGTPKTIGTPTKFYGSAMSTAIKHNKEGKDVTVRYNDHKGVVDSVHIKAGERVKAKMDALKDKRVDESNAQLGEADIYSIKNTKTGQLYHTSKYPITSSNRTYQKIKSAGGDHEHATIHMNGKPLKTDTSNSKPSETKPVKTSNPPKSTLDKPKTATDFAKGVVSSTASSLLASKRKTDESITNEGRSDDAFAELDREIKKAKTPSTTNDYLDNKPATSNGTTNKDYLDNKRATETPEQKAKRQADTAAKMATPAPDGSKRVSPDDQLDRDIKAHRAQVEKAKQDGTIKYEWVELDEDERLKVLRSNISTRKTAKTSPTRPKSLTGFVKGVASSTASNLMGSRRKVTEQMRPPKGEKEYRYPEGGGTGGGTFRGRVEPTLGPEPTMNQGRYEPTLGARLPKDVPPSKTNMGRVEPTLDKSKKTNEDSQLDQLKTMRKDPQHTSNPDHASQLDRRIKMAQDRHDLDKGEVTDKTGKPVQVLPPADFAKKNPNFNKEEHVAEADNSTTMNTLSKDHIGTGESPDMQMAVDMAKAQARMKALQSMHGTSFQDKPMPNHEFGKLDVQATGKGYKVNAPLKMLETKELQMQMLDEISNKIKIKVNMPKPTKAEIAQAKYRKEKGLPNPSQYKTMAAQKQKEIDDMKSEAAKPGLYANIHAKRKRIAQGSGERMRKPGTKGSPTAQSFKDAAKTAKK